MFSDAALHLMRAAKASPTATALACTALGFYTVRMHYMKKTVAHLEQNNRSLQAQLKEKKDEVTQRLQLLEEAVKKDMTQRDAFLRKMELQNVEQTRSVDRLQHALRSCSLGTSSSSSSSSVGSGNNNNTNTTSNSAQPPSLTPTIDSASTNPTQQGNLQAATATAQKVPTLGVSIGESSASSSSSGVAGSNPTIMAATPPPSYVAVVTEGKVGEEAPSVNPSQHTEAPAVTIIEVPSGAEVPSLAVVPSEEIIVIQEIDRLAQLRSKIVQQQSGGQHSQAVEISAPSTTTMGETSGPAP